MGEKGPREEKPIRAAAKTLLIPKMAPLLLLQLFVYGIVGLIAFGTLGTKYVRPGLAAWGIKVETPADRQAAQGDKVEENTVKIQSLENRLTAIEGGVRAILEAVAPDRADLLPPIAKVTRSHE